MAAVKAHVMMDLRGAIHLFVHSNNQTMLLATPKSQAGYPERLRRVSFRDPETAKHLVFLTNLFEPPANIKPPI